MTTPFGEQALAIVSAQFTVPQNSPYSDSLHSLMRKSISPKYTQDVPASSVGGYQYSVLEEWWPSAGSVHH